jgi:hypothetical protein
MMSHMKPVVRLSDTMRRFATYGALLPRVGARGYSRIRICRIMSWAAAQRSFVTHSRVASLQSE